MSNYSYEPKRIALELVKTFNSWRWHTDCNKSDLSNSFYIKLSIGTRKKPESIHIRVADHSSRGGDSRFNYDVISSCFRDGCITYPKLVKRLAEEFGKQLPSIFYDLLRRENYKSYSMRLRENGKLASYRARSPFRFKKS